MDEQTVARFRRAKKVIAAREQKGWSQSELGDAIGRGRDAISRLESPTRRPIRLDEDLRRELAQALGIYEIAFCPMPELNMVIRGRIGHQFYCLHDQLPQILGHSLKDIHAIHPDILSLSLMYEHDVYMPGGKVLPRHDIAWASLNETGSTQASEDRVERATKLPPIAEPLTDVAFNLLPAHPSQPGSHILETRCADGSLWVGLHFPPVLEIDGQQIPDQELIGSISHIADQLQDSVRRAFPKDQPPASFEERLRALEQKLL